MLTYWGGKVKGTTFENFDVFNPSKLTIFHWMALFAISIIVGFRYEVGTDWQGYKDWFEYFKIVSFGSLDKLNFEIGFLIFSYGLAKVGADYTLMFFIIAFVSWFFIFKGLTAKILPLFLFLLFADEYFFWSMNVIRQFLCLGIFLYSIRFIIQRKPKEYFFLVTLAILFHTSAAILILFYFLPWEKLYKPKYWFIVFLISIFLANTPIIMIFVEKALFTIGEIIPLFSIYIRYFESGKFGAQELNVGLGYLFRLFIAFFIFFYSNKVTEKYPNTKIFFVLFFIGSIIYNLFYMVQLIGRINHYFIFMRSVCLSLVLYYLWTEKKRQSISMVVMALYFIIFLVTIYNSSNDCSPYQFRLE